MQHLYGMHTCLSNSKHNKRSANVSGDERITSIHTGLIFIGLRLLSISCIAIASYHIEVSMKKEGLLQE